MNSKKVHIYCLSQEEKDYVYIGSSVEPKIRLTYHKSRESFLIKKRLFSREKIKMSIIHIAERKDRFFWEKHYMDMLLSRGFKLVNIARIINPNRKERTEFRYLDQR